MKLFVTSIIKNKLLLFLESKGISPQICLPCLASLLGDKPSPLLLLLISCQFQPSEGLIFLRTDLFDLQIQPLVCDPVLDLGAQTVMVIFWIQTLVINGLLNVESVVQLGLEGDGVFTEDLVLVLRMGFGIFLILSSFLILPLNRRGLPFFVFLL